MSDNSNKKDKKLDLNKVEEPTTEYFAKNKAVEESELHPILIQLLEKSVKEAEDGKLIPHEEALRRIREKIQSLK